MRSNTRKKSLIQQIKRDENEVELELSQIYKLFSKGQEFISIPQFLKLFDKFGFLPDDPRWKDFFENINKLERIDEQIFCKQFQKRRNILSRAAQQELIIPEFREFSEHITEIFESCRNNKGGAKASYIPQLDRVDPQKYGLGLCTIDGQRMHIGDSKEGFCVQSCSKPITYGIACETVGQELTHKHVDREPSGQAFNSMALTRENIPYNPMVNAGAIMTCSLLGRDNDPAERFESVMNWWKRLAGGFKPGFDNSVYLSERLTADRNFSLAYMMKAAGAFPEGIDLVSTLEFYFQCCSIEMNCESMAILAGTLANGGVCPVTGERVFSTKTTTNVLSLMFSCGMYDYSGQYAFSVGLPAQSGVSGIITIVVPGVCGICIWSPQLDKFGNSVRGIEFSKKLVDIFKFHNFDNLSSVDNISKLDPRTTSKHQQYELLTTFLYACMEGDINTIQRMITSGYNLNTGDYDKRTGLHIAAAEGHYDIVQLLLENGAQTIVKDRWGNTPHDDAVKGQFEEIAQMINEFSKKNQHSMYSPKARISDLSKIKLNIKEVDQSNLHSPGLKKSHSSSEKEKGGH